MEYKVDMKRKRKEIMEGNNRTLTNGKRVKYSSSSSPNPKLPVDLVVVVLATLPAATLERFRCVCKSWDSLIREDRQLASLHLECSRRRRCTKKLGLVMLSDIRRCDTNCFQVFQTLSYSLGDDPTVHKLDLGDPPLLGGGSYNNITNSCDGLIGVCGIDSFHILNPSIRKIAALPQSSPHIGFGKPPAAGLGFDASSGEYKVVRMFYRGLEGNCWPASIGCEVISLGGKEPRSWRLIDDDPPAEASLYKLPVAVNGSIYWTLRTVTSTGFIFFSFDLSREKFGILMRPKGTFNLLYSELSITELRGCLCAAVTQPDLKRMCLWLLKDPSNSNWVKLYEIGLSQIYRQVSNLSQLKPLTFHKGKLVLDNGEGRRDYYNPRTRRFGKHDPIAEVHFQTVSLYVESIVWPWSRFLSKAAKED